MFPVNGFTVAEIREALTSPSVRYLFEYWAVDHAGLPQFKLPNLIAASSGISMDASRDILTEIHGEWLGSTDFNVHRHRIVPYVCIQMKRDAGQGSLARYPQGVFQVVKYRPRPAGSSNITAFSAADLGMLLTFETIAPIIGNYGDSYTTLLSAVATAAGFTPPHNIEYSPLTLPIGVEYPKRTSRLQIVKDLCSAISYFWYVDRYGKFTARRIIDYALRGPVYDYVADSRSVMYEEAEEEDKTVLAANYVEATVTRAETGESLHAYRHNTNAGSDLYSGNRGFIVPKFLDNLDARLVPDLPALQEIVDRTLEAESYQAKRGTVSTQIMPFHGPDDVIKIVKPNMGWDSRFVLRKWGYNFTASARMTMEVEEIVAVS